MFLGREGRHDEKKKKQEEEEEEFYQPEFFESRMFPQGIVQQVLHHWIIFPTHVTFARRHSEEFRFAFAFKEKKSEKEITFGYTVCYLH